MKTIALISAFLAFASVAGAWQKASPDLKVGKDGYPAGHATPEGAACDLARAFITHDVALFKAACLKQIGGAPGGKPYTSFLEATEKSILADGKKSKPSPNGPKSIGKLFAARHLSKDGPASYGYAVFNYKDIMFVDVGVFLHNGDHAVNRTLVIEDSSGKWFVHPVPSASPLLSDGLNEESQSTKDFTEAYTVHK